MIQCAIVGVERVRPDAVSPTCFRIATHITFSRLLIEPTTARFTTAVNSIPWSVTNHNALALDGLTIVCGGDNFFPDVRAGINAWTDYTDFYTVYSINHHFNNDARLCGSDGIAMTISIAPISPTTPTKGEIILLCDEALVKGNSPDSTGSQAGVAAISALPGTAGLYPGKLMDDLAYTACLSFTLVHELFHATQMILCQLSFLHNTSAIHSGIKGLTYVNPGFPRS